MKKVFLFMFLIVGLTNSYAQIAFYGGALHLSPEKRVSGWLQNESNETCTITSNIPKERLKSEMAKKISPDTAVYVNFPVARMKLNEEYYVKFTTKKTNKVFTLKFVNCGQFDVQKEPEIFINEDKTLTVLTLPGGSCS